MPSLRDYCFTIFGDVHRRQIKAAFQALNLRYMVYQREKCPETGRKHYQGYLESKDKVSLRDLKAQEAFAGAHFEARKGTREQARDYCMKEESRRKGPWEYGDWITGAGSRTDLNEVKAVIQKMTRFDELALAEQYFPQWVKYYRAFHRYYDLKLAKALKTWDFTKTVTVYWGEPGTGKTRRVYEEEPNVAVIRCDNGFWSPYNGQEAVLFDDFDGGWCKRNSFLQMTDRYQCQINQKGGTAWWWPKRIYITSNAHPRDWYNHAPAAVVRRMDKIVKIVVPATGLGEQVDEEASGWQHPSA